MVATLITVIAQNSQEAPDEGTGIGLILLGVLIAVAVAVTILMVLRRASKHRPTDTPHVQGHVGVADPADTRTGARIDPSRRGVEQSGSSSGS